MGGIFSQKKEDAEVPLDSPCEIKCPKCGAVNYFGPRVEAVNCFGSKCITVVRRGEGAAIKLESGDEAFQKSSNAIFTRNFFEGIRKH